MRYWKAATETAGYAATNDHDLRDNDHDLRDLNSWSCEQLYSQDVAHVEITAESKKEPTQVEHNIGKKNWVFRVRLCELVRWRQYAIFYKHLRFD